MVEAGTRLGPYEIVESLGAGGMGEVWRAQDTRLDRDVAIKVLPAGFAASERFLQRFQREARSISRLNHPYICTLHDVGEEDGCHYLVMELLEGESLADRLKTGPLPLHEVLRYGQQIASALDAAHRNGITHRDLKPGNVMLTKSGAKLLDFGLAKAATESSGVVEGLTQMPTEQKPLTEEGTIVGTFQYMAPEQLEGLEADARTDIFALGTLLYEMATGQRAFRGETKTSLIAAIVSSHPEPISQVTPMAPPALDHVVRKCLEKDPDDRWQSAHDVASELEWISEAGSQAGVASAITRRRKSRESLAWAIAGVLLLTLLVTWFLKEAESRPKVMQLSLIPPQGLHLIFENGIAVSPDGRHVVFPAGDGSSPPRLYIRSFEEAEARPLVARPGGRQPFWSPDSRHVAFFVDGELKRIAASGGLPQTICDAVQPRGGSWGPDDTIVFSTGTIQGRGVLSRVPASGGEPQPLTELNEARRENSHRWPWFLPDGEHLLFCSQTSEGASVDDESSIEVLSLSTRERKRLLGANSSVVYSSGHVLYWHDGSLVAQPFDAGDLAIKGKAIRLANVGYSRLELGAFAASPDGILIYQEGDFARSDLVWMSFEGHLTGTIRKNGLLIEYPALSPDETRIAFYHNDDIWVTDLQRDSTYRLTTAQGQEEVPIWSHDGGWIFYTQNDDGRLSTYRVRSNGTGDPELIFESEPDNQFRATDVAPDGRHLIGVLESDSAPRDIARLELSTRALETILDTPYEEMAPNYSPDGEWFTMFSDRTGRNEIYVHSIEKGETYRISTNGGVGPEWSDDGTTIYYLEGANVDPEVAARMTPSISARTVRLVSVEVSTEPTFEAGPPEPMMTAAPSGRLPFEVSRDESRILWNLEPENTLQTPPLTIIRNWPLLLRKDPAD